MTRFPSIQLSILFNIDNNNFVIYFVVDRFFSSGLHFFWGGEIFLPLQQQCITMLVFFWFSFSHHLLKDWKKNTTITTTIFQFFSHHMLASLLYTYTHTQCRHLFFHNFFFAPIFFSSNYSIEFKF